MYIGLDTTATDAPDDAKQRRTGQRFERETKLLSVLKAVSRHPTVVLLGEPGSGKSTFTSHLALCLAANVLSPEDGWLSRIPGWPRDSADLVPIVIVLRDFAAWLPTAGDKAGTRALIDFVNEQLAAQKLEFAAPFLARALDDGKAIVLFDGLDEIPESAARARTREAVASFTARYRDSRHVVTCRTLSYQDRDLQPGRTPSFQIAPFDRGKIEAFIRAWYAELERIGTVRNHVEAEDLGARLRQAVERPDLQRLAPNPLLLTVMAIVNTHTGRLPDARALVYRDVVDLLLWRWDEIKATHGDEPVLRKLIRDAGLAETDVIRILSQLAFEAQENPGRGDADAVADIPEATLVDRLAARHPKNSHDWAREVTAAMKLRAGLLVERAPHVFGFPHRTFQEHLAGVHLSTRGDFAKKASELLDEGSYWLQTVLLGVGRLVHVAEEVDKPLALVGRLCPEPVREEDRAWRKAWFAGEALVEFGVDRANADDEGRGVAERVRWRLVSLLERGRLNPVERAAAGASLGCVGDPRFRADAWFLPVDDPFGFVEVPRGGFTMGSDKATDAEAYSDEEPAHPVELLRYFIGKFPVTVAQFRAFVEDPETGGFRLEDPDALRGVANQPVTWVSWHEALAYCRWLTVKLRESESTPEPLRTLLRTGDGGGPWRVTLPSEAEWEKAARGTKGRRYPWSDELPDVNRANYAETGIGGPSAVGCFPRGATPDGGVLDLAGNVWEWTRSLWSKKWDKSQFLYPYVPDPRGISRENLKAPDDVLQVVRGGAFSGSPGGVRAACRYWFDPVSRDSYIGFRVVVSPFFSDL